VAVGGLAGMTGGGMYDNLRRGGVGFWQMILVDFSEASQNVVGGEVGSRQTEEVATNAVSNS